MLTKLKYFNGMSDKTSFNFQQKEEEEKNEYVNHKNRFRWHLKADDFFFSFHLFLHGNNVQHCYTV